MTTISTTAYDIASRFVGVKEVAGSVNNPQILAMLRLDDSWPASDEVPWCSAFVNYVAWLLRLPRSKSLMARSWLNVGKPIDVRSAVAGFDVVVFWRGQRDSSAGHVGFFAGWSGSNMLVLGGNQSDAVTIAEYPPDKLLGIRRLYS